MGDNGMLRFGLVLYDKNGDFLHGFHEEQTGLTRPKGLSHIGNVGATGFVGLCDWNSSRTVILNIDWEEGTVDIKQELVRMPFVDSMAFTSQNIVTISYVCCQLEYLVQMALYDMEGGLIKEVKELPTGEVLDKPIALAVDYSDNIWLSDGHLGKTVIFDSNANYLGELKGVGVPQKILFYDGKVFTLTEECLDDGCESYVNVYSYHFE